MRPVEGYAADRLVKHIGAAGEGLGGEHVIGEFFVGDGKERMPIGTEELLNIREDGLAAEIRHDATDRGHEDDLIGPVQKPLVQDLRRSDIDLQMHARRLDSRRGRQAGPDRARLPGRLASGRLRRYPRAYLQGCSDVR